MLEESNAFTMVLLDLSSLQTNVYTRLRITDYIIVPGAVIVPVINYKDVGYSIRMGWWIL